MSNGARLVYHSNHAAGPNSSQEQANAQDTELRSAFGGAKRKCKQTSGVVSPIDYRFSRKGRDYSSTTFGVRDVNNVWSFYTQRYAVTPMSQPEESVLKEVKWLF